MLETTRTFLFQANRYFQKLTLLHLTFPNACTSWERGCAQINRLTHGHMHHFCYSWKLHRQYVLLLIPVCRLHTIYNPKKSKHIALSSWAGKHTRQPHTDYVNITGMLMSTFEELHLLYFNCSCQQATCKGLHPPSAQHPSAFPTRDVAAPPPHSTCCLSSRILLAAFLLSLSQAEARILSATAEVRCEGIGRDYERKRERQELFLASSTIPCSKAHNTSTQAGKSAH